MLKSNAGNITKRLIDLINIIFSFIWQIMLIISAISYIIYSTRKKIGEEFNLMNKELKTVRVSLVLLMSLIILAGCIFSEAYSVPPVIVAAQESRVIPGVSIVNIDTIEALTEEELSEGALESLEQRNLRLANNAILSNFL